MHYGDTTSIQHEQFQPFNWKPRIFKPEQTPAFQTDQLKPNALETLLKARKQLSKEIEKLKSARDKLDKQIVRAHHEHNRKKNG